MTATIIVPQLTLSGVPVGKDADVDSGVCWAGMFDSPAAVAAKFPFIQIFNPSDSGKRIYVDRVVSQVPIGQEIGVVWSNTALGNLKTDILPYNLKNGTQTGYVAQIRTGQSATQILYPFVDVREDGDGTCFRPFEQPYPTILDPGHGQVVIAYAPNTQLISGFYWREY